MCDILDINLLKPMCINSELDLMASLFDIIIPFTLSFIIHMQLAYIARTLSFIQNISLFLIDKNWIVWNQLRSGGKGKEQGQKGKSDGLEGGGGRGEMQQSLETCL